MTKAKQHTHRPWCTCAPDSPFLWASRPRPSMFDTVENRAGRSEKATAVITTKRAKGIDPGHIAGLSKRSA